MGKNKYWILIQHRDVFYIVFILIKFSSFSSSIALSTPFYPLNNIFLSLFIETNVWLPNKALFDMSSNVNVKLILIGFFFLIYL